MKRGRYGQYYHRVLTLVDFLILNAVMLVVCLTNPEVAELRERVTWLLVNVASLQ